MTEAIGYMRTDIPDFHVSPPRGASYRVLAPDTVDIQEMARLASNVLTRATDPESDYEPYFSVYFKANPPVMEHNFSGLVCHCKFMEALPLVREVAGVTDRLEVDKAWMETVLKQIGQDGLPYLPVRGKPWASNFGDWEVDTGSMRDAVLSPVYIGRLLSAVVIWALRDPVGPWTDVAAGIVEGLSGLAIHGNGHAYYAPSVQVAVRGTTEDEGGAAYPLLGAHASFIVLGLVHAHRHLATKGALDLARRLLGYVLDVVRYFDEEGKPVADSPSYQPHAAHFHMHSYTIIAMIELARETGDVELMQKARQCFERAVDYGEPTLGYFPEFVNSREYEHCELCTVADLIAAGVKLSVYGVGDYWDLVERWVRNMYSHGQLQHDTVAHLERYSSQFPPARLPLDGPLYDESVAVYPEMVTPGCFFPEAADPSYFTDDDVLQRNIGAFAGWATVNDFYVGHHQGLMHCCTANGSRTLRYLAQHIVERGDQDLRINCLLNFGCSECDVNSYLPYVGRIDIQLKAARSLEVRIPEWVASGDVSCTIDGTSVSCTAEGRYATVGPVEAGRTVTFRFPISDRRETVWVEKTRYCLAIRGNQVVAVDPPGINAPLFERFRDPELRYRQVTRFVSEEGFEW